MGKICVCRIDEKATIFVFVRVFMSIVDLTLMCTMFKLNLVQSIILRLMLQLCTKLVLIIKSVTCTK